MRLLFCLDYYRPHLGGAEILFAGLCEGLAANGCHVDVVTQAIPGTPADETLAGVHVHRVRTLGSRGLLVPAAFPTLLRLGRHADLIHTSTFAAAIPARLAAALLRKPLVLTVHEVWLNRWQDVTDDPPLANALHNAAEHLIYAFNYQNYVCVSQATARDLAASGIPQSRIHVIHNGLDLTFWNPDRHTPRADLREPGTFTFLFTGRPGISKGLPWLLEAMARVVAVQPQARLVAVVSHAPAVRRGLEQAQRLIARLGLDPHVRLLHPVPKDELPSLILAADTVVVPSLSEGFGFAAAEACALRRPVIATDNASLPEVVSGQTLLVPPRNADALADAMLQAIRGHFTPIPPRTFDEHDTLRRHLQLYQRLISASPNAN